MSKVILHLLLCFVTLFFMGCNNGQTALGGTAPETPGVMIFRQNGCQACHAVEPGVDVPDIGPNLAGSAAVSARRLADPNYTGQAETVAAYIKESIVRPELYITEGYEPVMPNYAISISEADLAELVKYLEGL